MQEHQSGKSDMKWSYAMVVGATVWEAVEDAEVGSERYYNNPGGIWVVLVLTVEMSVFLQDSASDSLSLMVEVSASGMYRYVSMQGMAWAVWSSVVYSSHS